MTNFFDDNFKNITPGIKIQAWSRGQLKLDFSWGDVYKYYDLASLTKVIFTNSLIMRMVDEGNLKLEENVSDILSWYKHDTTILELLNHTAGNIYWLPLYEKFDIKKPLEERFETLKIILEDYTPGDKSKSVYSDIDFLILLFVLESVFEKTISEIWTDFSEAYYSDYNFFMNPKAQYNFDVKEFAPTENCRWRGKLLQGEVHDQNTWAMGGVSTHAGLFSDIDSVSLWALRLRNILKSDTKDFISKETLALFTKRSIAETRGDWGIGFMMPTRGNASCGKYFSENSFGHTGFTGTSVWIDPDNDWIVVILANRVYFSTESKEFPQKRGLIHDQLIDWLK